MAKAADEMSHWAEYDYVVINDDIDCAFAEVRTVLAAERLKRERQIGLSAFVRDCRRNFDARGASNSTDEHQMVGGGAKKHLRTPPHSQRQYWPSGEGSASLNGTISRTL